MYLLGTIISHTNTDQIEWKRSLKLCPLAQADLAQTWVQNV